MAKMLLITRTEVREEEVDGLHDMYRLLDCNTIDIVSRYVLGKEYHFIVDDEGLFKSKRIPSAYRTTTSEPALVNNLLITHYNEEGEEVDLTDEDIEFLKRQITDVESKIGNKWIQHKIIFID